MKRGRPKGIKDRRKRKNENYRGRPKGAVDKAPRGGYKYWLRERETELKKWGEMKQVRLVPRGYTLESYLKKLNIAEYVKPFYWRYKYLNYLIDALWKGRYTRPKKAYRPRFMREQKRRMIFDAHREKLLKLTIEEFNQIEAKVKEIANMNKSG